MAETDDPAETTSSSHVVIDVDEAAAGAAADEAAAAAAGNMSSSSSCSCAVCMEPMEWVAVFPCGHRDVCARCAAQLRFFHNDRRCCICRSYCATVVVTRADDDDRATTTTSQRERPFLSPPPPPAFGGQQARLQVGVNYWYHRDMGAYFDDLSQYQEMCSATTAGRQAEYVWALLSSPPCMVRNNWENPKAIALSNYAISYFFIYI
ncbi:hypothetical protein BDA96_05G199700 [Sorghum bicolor]|uniref:RING-type domain-containing protein n=1 Tax=Sorghum bicolor TaxID=4558 RepID=A0A921UI39_SORBI|nr:hypothetical protein BDA96_05G199700 [Sorghum bicolor]